MDEKQHEKTNFGRNLSLKETTLEKMFRHEQNLNQTGPLEENYFDASSMGDSSENESFIGTTDMWENVQVIESYEGTWWDQFFG